MGRDGRRSPGALGVGVALASGLVWVLGAGTVGCDSPERRALRTAQVLFDANCAGCHGRYDRGQGPQVVPGTGERAPDLRTLSQRLGRPLPRDVVAKYIDGRSDVAAHGSRSMPVWGDRLYAEWPASESREEARAGTIDLLVDYIVSIQED